MSDYLSRLVKRSHNNAEVIKPRLASIFEPPVQDEISFRGEYGSDHLNVDPISDETEYNDLWPTRPSSDPASKNGELKELHKENHKPNVRPGAFQQTGQPEPQHHPDPQRLDRTHSILKHDIGRFPGQLISQPSKQDHTAQMSPDNRTDKTHDMPHRTLPHRTDGMKSQPYAQDPAIRSGETRPSAPVLPQSNQQLHEQVQAPVLPQSDQQPHEQVQASVLPQSDQQPHEQVQAPVLPQSDQQPHEQVQAPVLPQSDQQPHELVQASVLPQSDQQPHELVQASVLPQSNQQTSEQAQALSSNNNKNHDMPHRSGTKRSRLSAQNQEIQPFVIKPAVSHEKMQITKPSEPIEPPVIKVTIGRIEVRAVTPPAPIPQQQVKQSSPVLSLDEYLRLRDGGGL